MNQSRPNILVICARNKRRSRTAEAIFKNDQRFSIRSKGLSKQSVRQLNQVDCEWADLILVMENRHKKAIIQSYRHIALPPIEVLDIPDEYIFMDPNLIEILTDKIDAEWDRFR